MLTGILELYGRTASQLEGLSVMTDLVPLDGTPPAISASAELQSVEEANDGPKRAAAVALPLIHVTPGEYIVRATVHRGGDTIAEVLRDVSVQPADWTPASPAAPALFEPLAVLRGDLARSLIAALDARARGGALERAAHAANAGQWPAIDPALAAPAANSVDGLILRGIAAFARADYTPAATAFRAARDGGCTDPALAFVLGWSLAAAHDDRAAVTAWRSGVLLNPASIPPYLALADAYVRLGQPMLARQVVESGLEAVPGSPELRERLAQLQDR
jgi:Flp pilus assembly protein TadD